MKKNKNNYLPIIYPKKLNNLSFYFLLPYKKIIASLLCTFFILVAYLILSFTTFNKNKENPYINFSDLTVLYYFLSFITIFLITFSIYFFYRNLKNKVFHTSLFHGWILLICLMIIFIIFTIQLVLMFNFIYKGYIQASSTYCGELENLSESQQCLRLLSLRQNSISWVVLIFVCLFFLLNVIYILAKNLFLIFEFQKAAYSTYHSKYIWIANPSNKKHSSKNINEKN